jgi:hypothetical protein
LIELKNIVKVQNLCYDGKAAEINFRLAEIAQLVEQRTENPRVTSSSLVLGITQLRKFNRNPNLEAYCWSIKVGFPVSTPIAWQLLQALTSEYSLLDTLATNITKTSNCPVKIPDHQAYLIKILSLFIIVIFLKSIGENCHYRCQLGHPKYCARMGNFKIYPSWKPELERQQIFLAF